jgi:hypothetical protein
MRIFFNRKDKIKTVQNLPDLIKKINKNELIDYKELILKEKSLKDPLYLRIQIDDIGYVNENLKEMPFYKKFILLPLKFYISKFQFLSNFRYEKEIYRPNVQSRAM